MKHNTIYFDNVIQIGKLYLEHIFYEFESEPILFSCIDGKQHLYLCLCCEIRYKQRWIITHCDLSTLSALINEKIDIAAAFLTTPSVISIDMDLHGNETSCIIKRNSIDRLDLPKEGIYIRCDKTKAQNYLWNKQCEALYAQLTAAIGTLPIANTATKSYQLNMQQAIIMSIKRLEEYTTRFSLIKQQEKSNEMFYSHISNTQKYSICIKEKSVEHINNTTNHDTDNFLDAA